MNKWTQHVKDWATKHKMKYSEALKDAKCKSAYNSAKGKGITGGKVFNPSVNELNKMYREIGRRYDALVRISDFDWKGKYNKLTREVTNMGFLLGDMDDELNADELKSFMSSYHISKRLLDEIAPISGAGVKHATIMPEEPEMPVMNEDDDEDDDDDDEEEPEPTELTSQHDREMSMIKRRIEKRVNRNMMKIRSYNAQISTEQNPRNKLYLQMKRDELQQYLDLPYFQKVSKMRQELSQRGMRGGAISNYITAVTKGRQDYPPKMREILKKYGDKTIIRMFACRKPVSSLTTSAINAVSLGEFYKRWENQPYDRLFHLDLRVDVIDDPKTRKIGTVLLEKIEVLNAVVNPKKAKETECQLILNIPRPLTINKMLEGAKQVLGDKFFKYSAYDNNCQDFIMALLKGVGAGTQENYDFIKQDTKELFRNLPGTRKLANTVTDFAATLNTIVQGAGSKPCWKGYEQYGMKIKKGREVPNCIPVVKGKGNWFTRRISPEGQNPRVMPAPLPTETGDYLFEIDSVQSSEPRTLAEEIDIKEMQITADRRYLNIFNELIAKRKAAGYFMKEGSVEKRENDAIIANLEERMAMKEAILKLTYDDLNALRQATSADATIPDNPEVVPVNSEPPAVDVEAININDFPNEIFREMFTPVAVRSTEGTGIHKGENYYIQSVVFDKSKFDSKKAREWLKKNNYVVKKPDITDNQIRFRQVSPTYIKQKGFDKFRTKKIGRNSGISLIISYK